MSPQTRRTTAMISTRREFADAFNDTAHVAVTAFAFYSGDCLTPIVFIVNILITIIIITSDQSCINNRR